MKKLLALCVFALLLAGCEKMAAAPVPFNGVDITGAPYASNFALTDHTGKPRTLADFKGKVVFLFFGFTQCPDVCPTTMTKMAQVRAALGSKAERLQVLFVTIDPERDTQELLAQYVPAFDPSFIGLYGDAAATATVAREFKVFYAKAAGGTAGNYSMDHTAASFVFDPSGKIRLYVRDTATAQQITQDIERLLN
ncbi:MAG TPA: SCO family protein [Telluria sp.]|jgi:protein SCO1/2